MNDLFAPKSLESLIQVLEDRLKDEGQELTKEQIGRYLQQITDKWKEFSYLFYGLDKSVIVAATDVKGNIIYANDKFCEISKYSREELIGQNHRIIKSGYHDKEFFKNMWKTIANGKIWRGQIKNKAKDGSFYWVQTTIVPIINEQNKPIMYIAFRTDITEGRLAIERLLEALKNDYRLVVNSMYNLVFKVRKDPNKKFIYVLNEGRLAKRLGLDKENMFQKSPRELFPHEIASMMEMKYENVFNGKTDSYTYSYKDHMLITHLSPVYTDGKIEEIIGTISDITELHKAQEEIKYIAYHDMLTDLPNQIKLKEDLSQWISQKEKFAVLFLDLDRFKQINDAAGHSVGDLIIKEVTSRLKEVVGEKGVIYRFSGDEFIILHTYNGDEKEIKQFVSNILSIFTGKFTFSTFHEFYVTCCVGISKYPDDGIDHDTLLKNANRAMFVAKSEQRNTYKIYHPDMMKDDEEVYLIERHLIQAIENNELELYFQPKMDLSSGKMVGMEALLRWKSPVLGNVPPDKFISVAEDAGLIIKIDEWVLEKACEQNKKWIDSGLIEQVRVAVNISPIHFKLPGFINTVKKVLDKTRLDPKLLEIEITENSFLEHTEECIFSLSQLKEMGVHVSIDDFGKGYSSLNYLRKLPVGSLKIDKSFILGMMENCEDIAIVKAIIYLSHELNLEVIAEGTETKEVIDILKQLGCDEAQGYYISKPVSKSEFEQFIKEKVNNVII